MKKLLAILMAAAMLLSVCVVCVLPVAAAPESDGNPSASNDEFVISTHKEDYFVEDDEDRLSRPGGVYTEDGFEVNPLGDEYADDYHVTWPNNNPYVTLQTLQDLSMSEAGYSMVVRIDAFECFSGLAFGTDGKPKIDGLTGEQAYDLYDTWFSFHVWDSEGAMPGQVGTNAEGNDFGNGFEMLLRIRPNSKKNIADIAHLEWYDDTEIDKDGRYRIMPSSNAQDVHTINKVWGNAPEGTPEDKLARYESYADQIDPNNEWHTPGDDYLYLVFELRFDIDNMTWTPYVNGYGPQLNPQGEDTVTKNLSAMIWGNAEEAENDPGKAYVGFSLQTFKKNAPASFTVVATADSKDADGKWEYSTPIGNESDAIPGAQRDNAVAEIVPFDPENDDESVPAFVITGDRETYKNHRDNGGSSDIFNTEDNTLLIRSHGDSAAPIIRVSNMESYNLRDYPVQVVVLKNFCTCPWALDDEGHPIKECTHGETIQGRFFAGDATSGASSSLDAMMSVKADYLTVTSTNEDGELDTYSVFLCYYDDALAKFDPEVTPQRIHGVFLGFTGLDVTIPGRNEFEIVAVAHLATEEGALIWAEDFVSQFADEELPPEDTDTEPAPTDTETEPAPTETETEPVPTETETEPVPTETETEPVPTETETEPVPTETETEPVPTETETEPVPTETETEPVPTETETEPVVTDTQTETETETETETQTETQTETETETETETQTETQTETETETDPADTETKKEEQTTEKPEDPDERPQSGCGSVAGFGAMAIVAVAVVGLISFKKKED